MPTFPTGLPTLTNPSGSDFTDSPDHGAQHSNANDAIEALSAKVGIDSSAVTTSHDYLINNLPEQSGTLKLANAKALVGRNSGDTAYLNLIQISSGNDIDLGGSGIGVIFTLNPVTFLDTAVIISGKSITTNTIDETTGGSGVTIDGLVIKDATGAGFLKTVNTYTSGDTWTKPSGLKFVIVEVAGPGGGGGGCATTSTNQQAAGKGGGGGGFSRKKIAVGDLGATETVTVGAGGSGGSAGNNAGSDGADPSSFGSLCVGGIGIGGVGGGAQTNNVLGLMAWVLSTGGAGGDGADGDVNITGGAGMSFNGGAGAGPYSGSYRSQGTQGHGSSANLYGSGGAGGVNRDSSTGTARTGGDGSDGIVIVSEYF